MIESIHNLDVQISQWAMHMGWPLEAMFRLVLSILAGGLIGLERELRGRQAGFRTNVLVCLGSTLVMIVSVHFANYNWPTQANFPAVTIRVDPSRIAYGVMTGVGFLGAGTIVHNKGSVRGLTTAAGMWCVAAIGLSVGFGLYLLAALATLLVVLVLWVLDLFEYALPRTRYRTVTIRRSWKPGCISDTIDRFRSAGLHVTDVSYDRARDVNVADINVLVAFNNKRQYYTFERGLDGDADCQVIAAREL